MSNTSHVWLTHIPIPPSINNAYPTSRTGRRFKSKELITWEREFRVWGMLHCQDVRVIKEEFQDMTKGCVIAVNCIYYFNQHRVLTKDGRPKRLDADNRLKCLLDQVTELIGIDDCYIWEGSFSKRIARQDEFCDVEILKVIPPSKYN